MTAGLNHTTISYPIAKGADPVRRSERVTPWSAPLRDPIDPETGEPLWWERGHVRTWLREALDILKRMPFPPGEAPPKPKSLWPSLVRDIREAYGYGEARVTDWPSPEEITDMDGVLYWLWWLPRRRDGVIVTGFALGHSSRRIARRVGRSHTYCVSRDKTCLQLIAVRLNDHAKANP